MIPLRALALVPLCLAVPLAAQQDGADAEFVSPLLGTFEAGIFCAPEPMGERDAPGTVAGTTHIVDEPPAFASHGRLVPAVLGVGFGAVAGLKGAFGVDGVTMQVTHPPFPGFDATEQSFETWIGPAANPGITFYQFDYGYELAVGDWVMEAWAGEELLYRLTFTVVPPEMLPELAGICGYEHLLSGRPAAPGSAG